MINNLHDIINIISQYGMNDRRYIFNELRKSILFHQLEQEFGISAERILDAIGRGSDLTKRGVRGIIAETVFATEIARSIPSWITSDPLGDAPYDVLMQRGPAGRSVFKLRCSVKKKVPL